VVIPGCISSGGTATRTGCRGRLATGDYSHGLLGSARRFPEVEEYIFHWALDDILDVAIANPIRETLSLLIYGYEKTPCTNCRLTAVEEMSKRGDLPGWIVEECRQGCDFYLREKLDLWKP
jgi:hypothetical protein